MPRLGSVLGHLGGILQETNTGASAVQAWLTLPPGDWIVIATMQNAPGKGWFGIEFDGEQKSIWLTPDYEHALTKRVRSDGHRRVTVQNRNSHVFVNIRLTAVRYLPERR